MCLCLLPRWCFSRCSVGYFSGRCLIPGGWQARLGPSGSVGSPLGGWSFPDLRSRGSPLDPPWAWPAVEPIGPLPCVISAQDRVRPLRDRASPTVDLSSLCPSDLWCLWISEGCFFLSMLLWCKSGAAQTCYWAYFPYEEAL